MAGGHEYEVEVEGRIGPGGVEGVLVTFEGPVA